MEKQVLDACCGAKMFWFDKQYPHALFCDIRDETHTLCDGRVFKISPDSMIDFRHMPHPDEHFNLVVYDPPHLEIAGGKSWQAKKYGKLERASWREDLAKGFNECWRVLKPGGTFLMGDCWQPLVGRIIMNFYMRHSKEGDVKIYSEAEIVSMLSEYFRNVSWEQIGSTAYIAMGAK